jgi:hypothetical protein
VQTGSGFCFNGLSTLTFGAGRALVADRYHDFGTALQMSREPLLFDCHNL